MLSWLRVARQHLGIMKGAGQKEDGEWEQPELSDDSDWEQVDDETAEDLSADAELSLCHDLSSSDDEGDPKPPSCLVKSVTGLVLTMVASYFVVILLSLALLFHAYMASFFATPVSTDLIVMPQKAVAVTTTSHLMSNLHRVDNLFSSASVYSSSARTRSSAGSGFSKNSKVVTTAIRKRQQIVTTASSVFFGPEVQPRNVSFIQREQAGERALNVRALVKGLLLRVRNKTEVPVSFPLVPVPQMPTQPSDFDFLDFKLQHAMLDAYVSKITRPTPFHGHSVYSYGGSRSRSLRGMEKMSQQQHGSTHQSASSCSRKANEKKARSNRSKHFQKIDNLPARMTANPFKNWEQQQVTFSQFLATISEEWGGFPLKRQVVQNDSGAHARGNLTSFENPFKRFEEERLSGLSQFLATISEAGWTSAFSGPLAFSGSNATRERAMVLRAQDMRTAAIMQGRRTAPRAYRTIPSRRVIIPPYETPNLPARQPISRPSTLIATPEQNEPKTFLFVQVKSQDYPYLLSGFSVKNQECANFTLLVGEYTHTVISGLVGVEEDLAAFVENFRAMMSEKKPAAKRPLAIASSDDFKAVSPFMAQSWQICPASAAKFMQDLNVRRQGNKVGKRGSKKCSRKVDFVASNSTVVLQVSSAEPTRNLAKARAAYRALKKEMERKEAVEKARKAVIAFHGAPRLVPKYADVARVWKYSQLVAEPRVDFSKQVVPLEFFAGSATTTCPRKGFCVEKKNAV